MIIKPRNMNRKVERGKRKVLLLTAAILLLGNGMALAQGVKVRGNIFGGGEASNVTGNATVDIHGSERDTVFGNVYGGGEGSTDPLITDKATVVNTTVTVSAGNVKADVFGGGKGSDADKDLARVKNSEVNVSGTGQVHGNVYGGGEMASVGWLNDTGTAFQNGTGLAKVTISGGQVGDPHTIQTDNEGYVFGGGLGFAGGKNAGGKNAFDLANVDSTKVTISGGDIISGVFAGGDNGHVWRSTVVNMTGGTVGQKNSLSEFVTDEYDHAATHIYTGSVLGGGRGIATVNNVAGAYNDTTGIVFGNTTVNISGGTVRHAVYGGGGLSSIGTFTINNNGVRVFEPNTGKTTVNISGNALIGPKKEDLIHPVQADLTLYNIDSTKYVDSVFKYLGGNAGWVFGAGCGMAGSPYNELTFNDSAVVHISGGDIVSTVYGGGENGHVYNTKVTISGGTIGAVPIHGDTLNAVSEYEILSGPYTGVTVHLSKKDAELGEDKYGSGRRLFRGEVYGGGKGTDYASGTNYSLTAGRVYGNTNVIVTGGTIIKRVYGGGSLASVGTYTENAAGSIIPFDLASGGTANVTISGGNIGDPDHLNGVYGGVFGGGRGLVGKDNSQEIKLAYVGNTNVSISDSAAIANSVYGGSANGHVRGNTNVHITGGTIGTADCYGWHSNVYGGGGGAGSYKDGNKPKHLSITAGRVYGNTKVVIEGGTIHNNVYGGGALASVGTYDLRPGATDTIIANTAIDSVIVLGGTIGVGNGGGDVYGSARGFIDTIGAFLDSLSYAAQTRVIIGNTAGTADPLITGSVYGSGENGHVFHDAIVRILSGIVEQNVFGAGSGTDRYDITDSTSYNPIAGIAQSTEVTIRGGLVKGEVFGGGEMASVLKRAYVEVSGGTVGVASDIQQTFTAKGSVYGGGYGKPNTVYADFATVGSTDVDITGGYVVNSVYGGGKNGNVLTNTDVTVSDDGLVGVPLNLAQRTPDANEQITRIFTGNVYGGGRGDEKDGNNEYVYSSGRVRGNTNVTISGGTVRHSVYGGGALGSVGTFTISTTGLPNDDFVTGTGMTTVTVTGGLIGPLKADLVTATSSPDDIDAAFIVLGDNEGYVFGGGRGLPGSQYQAMAFTDTTVVLIQGDAQVVGSVYGGGENGHVHRGTQVAVSGGTIGGIPLHGQGAYTVPSGPYKDVVVHLSSTDDELQEDSYGIGPRIIRGEVYGGGKGTDFVSGTDYSFYAGRVFGNTYVFVSDSAVIYNKVYGGGSMASVGTYTVNGSSALTPYTLTYGGTANVTVSGGTIGSINDSHTSDGRNNGDVFGGGRGIVGKPGSQAITKAYVANTHVTIQPGAAIASSVYGGAANGHVLQNTKVDVNGGTIGTLGLGRTHSNVFGGGGGNTRYKDENNIEHFSITAGRVFGNTEVNVSDGLIHHNVYGGGAIASVGTYDLTPGTTTPLIDGTGVATVNILGGQIGTSGYNNGHVYGSSRGEIDTIGHFLDSLSYLGKTYVNIGKDNSGTYQGNAIIKGSVYGSGENGHVFAETNVNVYKGTIGVTASEFESMTQGQIDTLFSHRGNVYGAGCGTDIYDESIPTSYNPQSGIVWGNTNVNIYGGYISRNVYGGGAMASVGNHTATLRRKSNNAAVGDTLSWPAQLDFLMGGTATVNIRGGHIGTVAGADISGDVYGSSRGEAGDRYTFAHLANTKETYVTVNFTTPSSDAIADGTANCIVGSVYGSGENGHVYDTTNVTITSGLIGGSVYGGGKGTDKYFGTIWVADGNGGHTVVNDTLVHSITAGKVYGNTGVIVNGGIIKDNVYGGGNLASVGKSNYITYGEDGSDNALWNSGRTHVTVNGGTIGTDTWANNGHVFGSSKGIVYPTVTDKPRYYYSHDFFLGYANRTYVTIGDGTTTPTVNGSVFGGGENGHARLNTEVTVNSGTIGVAYDPNSSASIHDNQWKLRGNVYGAGRGVDTIANTTQFCTSAGSVFDTTHVVINGGTIHRSVYGGGSLATVGPAPGYTDPSISIVDILGGTIGDSIGVVHHYGGDVYGSSRGEIAAFGAQPDNMATVVQTIVNVGKGTGSYNPLINGSVYGSGENGHVKQDALVNVYSGRVGDTVRLVTNVNSGNVFGAGSGTDTITGGKYNRLAGIVYGNTTVNIHGGSVMRSVYGGGEMASVGTVTDSVKHGTSHPFLYSWPYKFTYAPNTGKTTVNVYGGRIGITGKDGPTDDTEVDNGDIYGGSKGTVGDRYEMALLANVDTTIININYNHDANTATPETYKTNRELQCVTGAVYGGGENGHVNHDTYVTLRNGLVGHAVYGGGKGKDQYNGQYDPNAGKVYGNTHISIEGRDIDSLYVVRSVFGGGNLASVGVGNYAGGVGDYNNTVGYGELVNNSADWNDTTNTGHTYVEITGGTLGMLNAAKPSKAFKDNIPYGSVFGGSRGMAVRDVLMSEIADLYGNRPDAFTGFVNHTHVTIGETGNGSDGKLRLFGSVYGGAQDGHVRWNTNVDINSGEIGVAPAETTAMGNSDYNSIHWTARGNVFGAGSGIGQYDTIVGGQTVKKYSSLAGSVTQKVKVNINGGTIHRNVYGGGDLATVGPPRSGTTDCLNTLTGIEVNINSNVGITNTQNYGGFVYGGSRGMANPDTIAVQQFKKFAFCSYATVNVGKEDGSVSPVVTNTVFGGGENGQMGLDVTDPQPIHNTVVNLYENATIAHSVYGGGQGVYGEDYYLNDTISGHVMGSTFVNLYGGTVNDVYGGSRRANILANATVNVGYEESGQYKGEATINGNVYGANNYNGSPFGNVDVNVYKAKQDYYPYDYPAGYTQWNADALHANAATQQYAIKQVFGGGNVANYLPRKNNRDYSGKMATVHVYGCYNTIEEVFGGANAADIGTDAMEGYTDVIIDGGRIHKVFGGGNGTTTQAANTYGTATTEVNGGLIDAVYGGGNINGSVTRTDLQIEHNNLACDMLVDSIFGGSNEAPITGDVVTTLACGDDFYENVYGGANDATINGNVTLNIMGNTITNVFGGSKGVTGHDPANITGNVTLNLYGGTIKNAFGGSDENGDITGVITVNVLDSAYVDCPLILDTVYGGSRNTPINATDMTLSSPVVNIQHGTVRTNVYGGSKGVLALTTSNPMVNIGDNEVGHVAQVNGNVFGGGALAQVNGNTTVNVNSGTVGVITPGYKTSNHAAYDTLVHGNSVILSENSGKVFGGGQGRASIGSEYVAYVNGNTNVNIKGGQVLYNVYGGGEVASVSDTAFVTVTGGQVGPAPKVETGYNIPVGLSGFDGYVFGGGQGIGNDPIVTINAHQNGTYYQFANVGTTAVTVAMPMPKSAADSVNNRIWGSVFGGSEDGHIIGNTHVNYVSGLLGTEGTTGYDGNIFGGGRNFYKKNYTAGRVGGNTNVEMSGGQILGSIFGGGRLGIVGMGERGPKKTGNLYQGMEDGNEHGNIRVVVKGGKVGNDKLITTWTKSSMGDVFGGGKGDMKGVEGHPKASALLLSLSKNTEVIIKDSIDADTIVSRPIIYGSVFGGGEVANVGNYTWRQSATDIYDIELRDRNSGLAKVTVSGGIIGAETMRMRSDLSTDPDHPYDLRYNDDVGHVVGGGEGLADNPGDYATINPPASGNAVGPHNNVSLLDLMATVGHTEVTISDSAFVKGSVYGGAMIGHVMNDAQVTIAGGQVGCGEGMTSRYTEAEFATSTSLAECPHWIYGDGNGNGPYYPYDPIDIKAGRLPSDGKSWFGNVFGGGSGYYPYLDTTTNGNDTLIWNPRAGIVEGNTKVTITGGHILTSVYGGGGVNDVLGDSTIVLMSSGTVGVPRLFDEILDHPVTCFLLGAGKGDPRTNFNTYTNVQNVRVHVSGGRVYGSVFGGGEEGHVLNDVKLTVSDTAMIGTFGYTGVDGIVFGAGRGFTGEALTAGTVGGNVTVNIKGGQMLGSVYGGGRMASVGTYLVPTTDPNYGAMNTGTDHGYVTVNVSGGTIGNDYESKTNVDFDKHPLGGNVYGGSKGGLNTLDGSNSPIWAFLGRTKQTRVNVSGGTIKSNVYGGGELGTVSDSATIVITGGDIWRDVYGGGYGSDKTTPMTTSIPSITYTDAQPMQIAGRVFGNTLIKLQGGWVRKSIYGGGEMASVGTVDSIKHDDTHPFHLSWPYEFTYANETGNATIQVTGGRVGVNGKDYMGPWNLDGTPFYDPTTQAEQYEKARQDNGDIYGGGKGMAGKSVIMAHAGNVNNATVSINYLVNDATPDNYKDTLAANRKDCIAGSVYGGAENGHVNANTNVTLTKGLVGHAIYGGGKGKGKYLDENNQKSYSITAGRVYGNTHVTINPTGNDENDVNVIRSVFGGGNLASVGIGTYAGGEFDTVYVKDNYYGELVTNPDHWSYVRNSGHTYVNIYGGTLGILDDTNPNEVLKDTIPYGSVFGGCRGMAVASSPTRFGFVNNTHVTIGNGSGDGPHILGSVYGGAQDGIVRWNANTVVNNGEIGVDFNEANAASIMGTANPDTVYWTMRGNVFGGGAGLGLVDEDDPASFSHISGQVIQRARLTVNGGTIHRNVYGGGNLAIVGPKRFGANDCPASLAGTTVTINGGNIGQNTTSDRYGGNVYGGSRGLPNHDTITTGAPYVDFALCAHTTVNINSVELAKNVYGGGENGQVGTQHQTDQLIHTATVNINGTSNIHGDVYGGGQGVWGTTGYANDTISGRVIGRATVNLNGGRLWANAFGGGQLGVTYDSTTVNVSGSTVDENVFGGAYGNRGSIHVLGLRTVNMRKGEVKGRVYGGSFNAEDARVFNPVAFDQNHSVDPVSVVNFSGGHAYRQVFGAGDHGQTFGSSYVFIGTNAILNAPNHTAAGGYNQAFFDDHDNLIIDGDVYAGADFGDYTQSGAVFGSSTITGRSHIYVDGKGYDTDGNVPVANQKDFMYLYNSLFGCGTLNDGGSQGKLIVVRNYGSDFTHTPNNADPEPLINTSRILQSIQYADSLIVENAHLRIQGRGMVNVSTASKEFSIYNIFDNVRVVNGGTLLVDKPIDNIGNLYSNKSYNYANGAYPTTPTYTEVTYDELTPNIGTQDPDIDNKIRINKGGYMSVSITEPDAHGNPIAYYGGLHGFFHLMTDGVYNAFAYARPKHSNAEGNNVASQYDYANDGGFVSYRKVLNYFDVDGGISHAPNDSLQMPYENHAPKSKHSDEVYFRVWRFSENASSVLDVWLIAEAALTPTPGYGTYIPSDMVKLPPMAGATAYYRIKRNEDSTPIAEINYGSEIKMVNAGKKEFGGTEWMYYDTSDHEYKIDDGSNNNTGTYQTFMQNFPNNVFGLTAMPAGAFTGANAENDTLLLCVEANNYLIADTLWKFYNQALSPEVQFMLTYSDRVNGNFSWDPISVTFEQVMDNVVIDEVTVYVHVVTKTRIEQDNHVKTYAMMTHAQGTGNQNDIYKAKMMLPAFQLFNGNIDSEWYLKKVEWLPNDTAAAPNLDLFGDTTLVKCDTYLDHNPTRNFVGMKFYPTYNVDNVNGWDFEPGTIRPVDLGAYKFDGSTNPIDTVPGGKGYFLGRNRGEKPISFDFDLHYDSDQNIGEDGNVSMGTLLLTVEFDNYKNSDQGTNHNQEVKFYVEVLRRGKGKGFYIDGVNGDVLFSGHYPDAAQPSLAGLLYFSPDYEPVDSIYIVNKVTANAVSNLEWNTRYNQLKIFRYPGGHQLWQDKEGSTQSEYFVGYIGEYGDNPAYMGPLVDVKTSMTVSSAMIDGAYDLPEMKGRIYPSSSTVTQVADRVRANAPMFIVEPGATLSLDGENHVLKLLNNYNQSSSGGAVYVADGGTLRMRRNAHLYDNYVADSIKDSSKALVVNEAHYGGGAYLEGLATLVASDSVTVSTNHRLTLSDAGVRDTIAENVYLNDYETVITLGTIDGKYVGLTTGKSRIGVTKTAWEDYSYMPIVYSDNPALWENLTATSDGFYHDSPVQIVFDQQENHGVLEYPFRHRNGDANYLRKLYWVKTWVDQVVEKPAEFDANDIDTPEELAWAISVVNGLNGQSATPGQNFTITGDIDMSDYIWAPIGVDNLTPYYGDFNGNGHLVTGLISPLPATYKGMFGYTDKNTTGTLRANIHDLQAKVEFYNGQGNTQYLGGLVGYMADGSLTNCESAGYLAIDTAKVGLGYIGGLVGKTMAPSVVHSSFATDTLCSSKSNRTIMGGLVGEQGNVLYNSYSRVLVSDENRSSNIGGLVGYNSGTVENCYADVDTTAFAYSNTGYINYCYANDRDHLQYVQDNTGTITGHGIYSPVKGRKEIGYLYDDNKVAVVSGTNDYVVDTVLYVYPETSTTNQGHITRWGGMVSALNEWVRKNPVSLSPAPTPWFRPTSAEVNADLPVLAFPADSAMATLDSDGRFLRYHKELDTLLASYANTSSSIFLYGNATEVAAVPTKDVKVYVNEDATLLQKKNANDFINTTVGVTFDNSSKAAQDYYDNTLAYDWHLMSTPLSNAKMGTTYGKIYPDDNALVDANGEYIPHAGQNVYFQTDSVDIVSMVDGYFPNDLKMGSGEYSGVKWDFYSYFEREYHWINLKRNKNNHFHNDALENWPIAEVGSRPAQTDLYSGFPHRQIKYTGAEQSYVKGTSGDDGCVLTPAKGYMMAISQDSYMNSTGILNKDTVSIQVTAQSLLDSIEGVSTDKGSNLVGNPYQAYLDLDKVSTSEVNGTLNKFWTYDADLGLYAPYTTDASVNPRIPSKYVHPHQGFFVVTDADTTMTFTPSMAGTKPNDVNAYFRKSEKPKYPLVNLFVSDQEGNRDLTIVEFNRPSEGGVPKIDNLRNAEFKMYARFNNADYGLLFAPVETERVPVFFKTPNDGTYTINWDKHHGNFTTLRLIDNIAGVDYDMLTNDHYTFESHATDYAARFYIVFGVTEVEEHDDDTDVLAFFNGHGWVVNGTGQLELVDMLGHVLYAKHLDGKPTMVHFDDVASGMYMLRLVDSKKVLKAQKIVIY